MKSNEDSNRNVEPVYPIGNAAHQTTPPQRTEQGFQNQRAKQRKASKLSKCFSRKLEVSTPAKSCYPQGLASGEMPVHARSSTFLGEAVSPDCFARAARRSRCPSDLGTMAFFLLIFSR